MNYKESQKIPSDKKINKVANPQYIEEDQQYISKAKRKRTQHNVESKDPQ